MTTVASVQSAAAALQAAFSVLTSLQLTASTWPQPASLTNLSSFDFIIPGGGAAGSILANRLTESGENTVLLIEAGGYPEFEATMPSTTAYVLKTSSDWHFTTQESNYYPAGKMLGGSGSMFLHMHTRSNPEFYDNWASVLNDSSWNYSSILPYFTKSENCLDEEIMASDYASYHGTSGPIGLMRYTYNETLDYLAAFEELGNNIILDKNGPHGVGFLQPLLELYDDILQHPAQKYLVPIKDRSNLYVLTKTVASRIFFNENNTATAIEVLDSSNKTWIFNATKEIVVATGAIKTPQLLMLSGIGPKEHLESFGIDVISDLPVGQNYQDLFGTFIVHKMKAANASTTPVSPYTPNPIFLGFASLNKSETAKADYMSENFVVSAGATTSVAFSSFYFGFHEDICQTYLDAQLNNDLLLTFVIKLDPRSRGKVLLQSTDPQDDPIIYGGFFNNTEDQSDLVKYLQDYTSVVNTTYFQSVGAEFVKPNLTDCLSYNLYSEDYWNCYISNMTITIFKYMSSAPMGEVVDTKLKVKGVSGLRVVDASVFPNATRSHPMATLAMIAEKGAAMILADYA